MRKRHTYSVYSIKTGELIASGDAKTCADKLNLSENEFYSFVFQNQDAKNPQYKIVVYGEPTRTWVNHTYKIYNSSHELLVEGTAAECAEVLKMTKHTFYSTVSRTESGKNKRYIIEKMDCDKNMQKN